MNENQLLDILTREGVLINVSVRYWRATKKLKAEDLGLNPDNVTDRLISLGHKKLLPKKSLKPFALIEGRAHALIDENTFPFLQGLSHFLPNSKLEEVTEKLNDLEREFHEVSRNFLNGYVILRLQAIEEWRQAANRLVSNPEELVTTIERSFPYSGKMERFFRFSTQLFQIRVPEEIHLQAISLADQMEIVRAREEAARNAASRISHDVEVFVSDCVATLRQQTAQLCEEMLESIRSSKTGIHQKTLNRLVRFIDQFKDLNFAGDREMEEHLERVRQELLVRSAEDYRDDDQARERLQQGLRGLADTARELAQQNNTEIVERFGNMGQRKFHMIA